MLGRKVLKVVLEEHEADDVLESLDGGVCSPRKKGLNGTMPALVNSKVGSPAGINDAEGMC